MNERWSHTLLAKLTGQFEALANSTHRLISTALLSAHTEHAQIQQTSDAGTQAGSIRAVENSSFGDPSCVVQQHVPDFLESYDSFAEFFGASGTSSFWEFPSYDMDMALHTGTGFFDDDVTYQIPSADQGNGWTMQQE
jgi:hypothetical protein